MSYYITITEQGLRSKRDISKELDECLEEGRLYFVWQHGDGYVDLDEGYFKWDDEFLKDLLVLKGLGVRGCLACYGEEGEYYKYEIDDEGVKEYLGSIVFPEKPDRIYKKLDDIEKIDF